jgi:hypothetical protein
MVRYFLNSDDEFQDMMIASRKKENDFILGMIELMSQRKPNAVIWQKLK